MSSYQYYEFQAIDRPLTPEEQQAVARLSSRVDPHPRRAIFTYSWSGFPRNEEEVLAQYYDAMLYMANWGSLRLLFRFPQALVDIDRMEQYNVQTLDYPTDVVTVSRAGEYAILSIQIDKEVAAEASPEAPVASKDELRRAIAALPVEEKEAFLLRLAQGVLSTKQKCTTLCQIQTRFVASVFQPAQRLSERQPSARPGPYSRSSRWSGCPTCAGCGTARRRALRYKPASTRSC